MRSTDGSETVDNAEEGAEFDCDVCNDMVGGCRHCRGSCEDCGADVRPGARQCRTCASHCDYVDAQLADLEIGGEA